MGPPQDNGTFHLRVLVEGQCAVISVLVHSNTEVEVLKQLILSHGLHSLEGVHSDRCSLFMVDINLDSYVHNINSLRGLSAENGVRLVEWCPISRYWEVDPPRSHLHIIAKVQPIEAFSGSSKRLQPDTQRDDSELSESQEKQAKRYCLGSNPSEVCKDARSMKAQQVSAEILNGRPWTSAGPPVGLFHPVFDQFRGYMQEPTPGYRTASSSDDDNLMSVDDAFSFMRASSEFYVTEQSGRAENNRLIGRVEAVLPTLSRLLGVNLVRVRNSDLTEPDARATTRTPAGGDGILTIAEFKLEPGINGDAKTQAQQSYARTCSLPEHKSVRLHSCCPCFLMAIEGPWITVMGAVYLQKAIVQHLAGPIFLPPQRLHDPQTMDYALRLFYALRKAFQCLDKYYSCLSRQVSHARFFPHIRSYGRSGAMKLEYITPPRDISKAVYLANVDGTKVIVKFALKYNAEAHCLLADNDLAPKLLYNGANGRRYGGLIMLVMEYVEGQILGEYLHSSPSQEHLEAIMKLVETAVHLLHGRNLVFGDLRTPNILVDNDARVRFVDFDWCGIHGMDRYPFIIGNGIEWAGGVGPLSVMDKAHDLHMLNNLLAHIRAREVPGTW